MADAGPEVFDEHLDAWRAWQRTPWGRMRYRVAAETLERTLADLRPGPLRVLDVGGGDGSDCLPLARAGHDVTIVDISETLLGIAEEHAVADGVRDRVATVVCDLDSVADLGLDGFDLVICHNVVQYREDLGGTVAALARSIGPDGALSLMAPNPAADVMSAVVAREEPAVARDLLDAAGVRTETFAHEVRRIPVEAAARSLDAVGLTDRTAYGISCVTHLVPNRRKEEPDFFAELEALELALCDREPYVGVARFWQLVARRPRASG